MCLDFDKVIDRRCSNCAKWDSRFIGNADCDVLPFWVADTDFLAPAEVTDALEACVRHGIFGYTLPPEGTALAAASWQEKRHGFPVREEWITFISGVDCALSTAVQAFTRPGDGVLVNSPQYDPFFKAVELSGRSLVDSPLILEDGQYRFDFDDFEAKAKTARLWLLCNPHNPSSRCLTRSELTRLGEICAANDLIIVSDEIHADIVYKPGRHIPIASLSPQLLDRTVTCTSPSKTFSVAGLVASVAIIANEELRQRFKAVMERNGINTGILGLVAMKAAYQYGGAYADRLLAYLQDNRDFLIDAFRSRIPSIKPVSPQATFLLWIDCSGLALTADALPGFFNSAGVRLSPGIPYREPTGQFYRMNFGCPRAVLEEGVDRIERASAALRIG